MLLKLLQLGIENGRVSEQVITTVEHVACRLEVHMSRNIGLDVKPVTHGSMVTVLTSRQIMSRINSFVYNGILSVF